MCDEFNSVQFTYDNPSDEEGKLEEKKKDTSSSEEEVNFDDI
jgi:hypothetical protein